MLDQAEVAFRVEEAGSWSDAELTSRLEEEAHQPFDLERGPLFRIVVFRRSDRDLAILVGIHHIVSDFWSISVILRDLSRLYEVERDARAYEPSASELRYSDFVRWQAEMLAGPEGERHWDYWRQALCRPAPGAGVANGSSPPEPADSSRVRCRTFTSTPP